MSAGPTRDQLSRVGAGPSTYLHAGAGSRGWPHDHSVDDTYEVPPFTWKPNDPMTWEEPMPQAFDPETMLTRAIYDTLNEDAALEANALNDTECTAAFLNSPVFTPEAMGVIHRTASDYTTEEFYAEFGNKGEARLAKRIKHVTHELVATFETFADARTAAEALNNHEGY